MEVGALNHLSEFESTFREKISSQENDGSKLFDLLCTLQTPEQIRDLFSNIEGP